MAGAGGEAAVSGGGGGACPPIKCARRIQIHKRGVSPPYDLPLSAGFFQLCRKEIVISGDNSHISGDNNLNEGAEDFRC